MDKLCLSVLNYYKSQIVSLWSITKNILVLLAKTWRRPLFSSWLVQTCSLNHTFCTLPYIFNRRQS